MKHPVFIFIILFFMLIPCAFSGEFFDDVSKPSTQADFELMQKKFLYRILVDSYEPIEKLEEEEIKTIKLYLEEFPAFFLKRHSAEKTRELIQKGDEIYASHKDPYVGLCLGVAKRRFGKHKDAKSLFQPAFKTFSGKQYPGFLSYFTLIQILESEEQEKASQYIRKALNDQIPSLVVRMMTDGTLQQDEERLIVHFLRYSNLFIPGLVKIFFGAITEEIEKNKKAKLNFPWAYLTIKGYGEINNAWKKRGSGWGKTVTLQGRESFQKHLGLAEKAFTEAYKLKTEYPESSAAMLTVCMGLSGNKRNELSIWFKRAASAQIDYKPAYINMFWALRPRWGGSIEEMLNFGIVCVETKRFDTQVPFLLTKAINDIYEETQNLKIIYQEKSVSDAIVKMANGYLERKDVDRDLYRSFLVMVEWGAGHYKKAYTLLSELGEDIHGGALPDQSVYTFVVGDILARATDMQEALSRADVFLLEGKEREAKNIYLELVEKTVDFRIKGYLKNMAEDIVVTVDFKGDDWVDVIPTINFSTWFKRFGEWRVLSDGSLEGVSDQSNQAALSCFSSDVQENFEIRGEIEIVSMKHPATAIIILPFRIGVTLRFLVTSQVIEFGQTKEGHKVRYNELSVNPMNTFHIKVEKDTFTLMVNGETLADKKKISDQWKGWWWDRVGGTGFAITSKFPGTKIIFRNIQVKKL